MEHVFNTISVLIMAGVILAAVYYFVSGLLMSIYWFRQTRLNMTPGQEKLRKAVWYDKVFFGRFAVLSVPEALTEKGLIARQKTLNGIRKFGIGLFLIALGIVYDLNITHLGG